MEQRFACVDQTGEPLDQIIGRASHRTSPDTRSMRVVSDRPRFR